MILNKHYANFLHNRNAQLIAENPALGERYVNRSVAEQNSLELSWNLLMEDRFVDLRQLLYTTDAERQRFRELVVNSVMATDIFDPDLKKMRNSRWDRAFNGDDETGIEESPKDAIDRKATIVYEHLIQASDVSHTMQHWHVYRKWNERLFTELYKGYQEGRSKSNPADFWAKGEIGFFDNVSRSQVSRWSRATRSRQPPLSRKQTLTRIFFLFAIITTVHYSLDQKAQGLWRLWQVE